MTFPRLSSRSRKQRAGLSIMEVLFAIGVLTVGLMGVAFILPVATNNASQALRDDRVAEEVNNRIAQDLARLRGDLTVVSIPENSNQTPGYFPAPLGTPVRSGDLGFNVTGLRFADQPIGSLPDAFCIDPWFLSAANSLRFTDTFPGTSVADLNAYDRTLFPCYDRHFVPTISPSDPIASSLAVTWGWSSGGAARTLNWNTPRFQRVSLPGIGANSAPSFALSGANTRSTDDLSVNLSDDSTLGAGLFVRRSNNLMRSLTESNTSGRFSSMIMMSRTEPGSTLYNAAVVTMQDRQLVTVPRAGVLPNGDDLKHQLRPYTAAAPTNTRPADEELTYPGEVMGYVTQATRPITDGGGGEFIFRTSPATRPDVKEGGWVCLMRQEYTIDPNNPPPGSPTDPLGRERREMLSPSGRVPVFDAFPQAPLRFGWYQIVDVVEGPLLDATGTFYQTQLAVRGPDWVFHPSQVVNGGFYAQPFFSTSFFPGPLVTPAGTPPAFDFATTGYPDFGTIIVCMPDVVSVRQFPIDLPFQ